MANITIEYMILIPLLILQIFLLPYAASAMMNYWTTSSETITLQDAASHIGSSIQQLYLFVDNPSISSVTVTNSLGVPTFINGNTYTGKATLTSVSGSSTEKVVNVTLSMVGSSVSAFAIVTLGQDTQWNPSYTTFTSNSPNACISAQKGSNGEITLSFAA